MHEIYMPQFQAAVQQGRAAAVMCAYSTINGQYACQNNYIDDVMDNQFGFTGFITSDWTATHSTVPSALAGLDMEMPSGTYFSAPLVQAVQNGQVPLSQLRDMASRILTEMFRFGLFNKKASGSVNAVVTNPAHAAVAKRVAEESTVLLRNGGGMLPLSTDTVRSIAVIGPDGTTSPLTSGGGSAAVTPPYVVSPLQGITARAGSGVSVTSYSGTDPNQAAATATAAQVAVVFASNFERERTDLPNITLSGNQNQYIAAVAKANPNTIVVLNTGSAVTMPWINQVKGVLEAWYPGQEDGNAIAAILFGDVDPSGKLPVTFPQSLAQVPASTPAQWPGVDGKVLYSEGLDVGYRWYDAKQLVPLFPFGFGLSYTNFTFSHLTVSPAAVKNSSSLPALTSGGNLATVTAQVTNTGPVAGADVAQLYLGDPSSAGEPPRQLKGFQKVYLQPGQSATVHFTLDGQALSYWDTQANGWFLPDGTFHVYVGDSSALTNLPLGGDFTIVKPVGARYPSLAAPPEGGVEVGLHRDRTARRVGPS